MTKTTILVENTTRELLKRMGRKNQTYDQLINELANSKQAPEGAKDSESRKGR